jgi:hypothetical protein
VILNFTWSLDMDDPQGQKQRAQKRSRACSMLGMQWQRVRLTFQGGLDPQEAGVSVSVFFYFRKAGRREKEQPRASQKTESKMG